MERVYDGLSYRYRTFQTFQNRGSYLSFTAHICLLIPSFPIYVFFSVHICPCSALKYPLVLPTILNLYYQLNIHFVRLYLSEAKIQSVKYPFIRHSVNCCRSVSNGVLRLVTWYNRLSLWRHWLCGLLLSDATAPPCHRPPRTKLNDVIMTSRSDDQL